MHFVPLASSLSDVCYIVAQSFLSIGCSVFLSACTLHSPIQAAAYLSPNWFFGYFIIGLF